MKACIKCREYAIIHAENSKNLEILKLFEGKHRGHTVVTLDFDEVKGSFKNFQEEKPEKTSESAE